jgi:Uma2 family endonuclease
MGMSGMSPTPGEPARRFTVEQYHRMIRQRILTEADDVELLEGWIVRKEPKNPPHRVATRLLRQALEKTVPPGWYVDTQEPVTLADSEPEPDAAIVRGDTRQYLDRHPGPNDLALVVEVADATLARDRGPKKRLFARAAIPVYWVVNLLERQVEVYSEPSGAADEPDYRKRQDYGAADEVPVVIEGREVKRILVAELLP